MKIAISAETTHDLPKELVEAFDIKSIPYEIVLGSRVVKDGEISINELFSFVETNKTLPHTTAINEFVYAEYFEELLKEYDAVVHITLSSGLTSSVGNAMRAAENFSNVFIVDSYTLSTGIGLLC
jgi:fatty acid-binding protein DegV